MSVEDCRRGSLLRVLDISLWIGVDLEEEWIRVIAARLVGVPSIY